MTIFEARSETSKLIEELDTLTNGVKNDIQEAQEVKPSYLPEDVVENDVDLMRMEEIDNQEREWGEEKESEDY